MSILIKRVWRTVGVWGTLSILVSLIIFYEWAFRSPRDDPGVALIAIVLFLVGLAQLAYKLRGYRRSQATQLYSEIVPPLLASAEEFGLLLRPFGADGETFLRQYETTLRGKKRLTSRAEFAENLTMEQVFAVAAQKAAKQKVYALVDQRRELAPPGPVYVRVANADWQEAIHKFMGRAYVVFLWLPADQDVRKSFNWEIEQIVLAGLQKRTIIVMPPPNNKAAHQRAVQQAAVLLAAMETATGKVEQTDPLRVQHYEEMLGDRATTMKFFTAEDGTGLRLVRRMVAEPKPLTWQRAILNVLLFWMMAWYGFAYFSDRRRNGRVNVLAYEQGLIKLLAAIRKDWPASPSQSATRVTAQSGARWCRALSPRSILIELPAAAGSPSGDFRSNRVTDSTGSAPSAGATPAG